MSISSKKPSRSRKATKPDPARTEERYALAMQSINYAVYDADLEGGEALFLRSFAQNFRDEAGRSRPSPPATSSRRSIPTTGPNYRETIVAHLKGDNAALRMRLPLSRRRRRLALVPPAWRRGACSGRPRLSHRRRDDRHDRDASARARARGRQGRGCGRLPARRLPTAPLTSTEERYALAMELINYGLYDWDLETNSVYFAPNLRILLGLTRGQALDAGALAQPHPSERLADVPPQAGRAPEGRDRALRVRRALSDRRRNVALVPPVRRRLPRPRRPRETPGRRGRRHHRDQAARIRAAGGASLGAQAIALDRARTRAT